MTSEFESNKHVKHGQFKVQFIEQDTGNSVDYLVNPLTQDELAEEWRLVLPSDKDNTTVHHFNIYLSQLPWHLWKSLKTLYDENGDMCYETIRDNIYHYTVKPSKYDDLVIQLYHLVMCKNPKKHVIQEVYNELEQYRVKGWIMLKAKYVLST
jgi:hypothetical protein